MLKPNAKQDIVPDAKVTAALRYDDSPVQIEELPYGSTERVEDSIRWRAFRNTDAYITFGGLWPCVGIIFYLPKAGVTLAAHMSSPENTDRLSLRSLLSSVSALKDYFGGAHVYLAGLAEGDDELSRTKSEVDLIRASLLNEIKDMGFTPRQITTHWGDVNTVMGINLHLKSGKPQIEQTKTE